MLLAGVDLAWQSERNGTAVTIGELKASTLYVRAAYDQLRSLAEVQATIAAYQDMKGIAIDAPLIVRNEKGQRECEKLIGIAYGSRKAACHTSNLKLYPDPAGVRFAKHLNALGFAHLGSTEAAWQLECYPHPALIEIFGLPERLLYKKGSVAQKRAGQSRLAGLLLGLEKSEFLPLRFNRTFARRLDPAHSDMLRGTELKSNEDFLDSLVCLYIAGLYAMGVSERVYGSVEWGYIYVPERRCA